MTWLETLDQLPPICCRLAARHNHSLMSLRMIQDRSGLSWAKTKKISLMTTWESVTIGDAIRFAEACGVDLLRKRHKRHYLRRVLNGPDPVATLAGKKSQEKYVQSLIERIANETTN